jgi:hypothetical protein
MKSTTTAQAAARATRSTLTRIEAEAVVKAAGFTVDELRSWFDAEARIGYVFSVESDRACFGHPLMEVQFSESGKPAHVPEAVESKAGLVSVELFRVRCSCGFAACFWPTREKAAAAWVRHATQTQDVVTGAPLASISSAAAEQAIAELSK